jgi:hypothetical protein
VTILGPPINRRQDAFGHTGGQLPAQGLPGGVDALVKKGALNTVISDRPAHTKDVGLDSAFQMMKDEPLAERAFETAEGSSIDASKRPNASTLLKVLRIFVCVIKNSSIRRSGSAQPVTKVACW